MDSRYRLLCLLHHFLGIRSLGADPRAGCSRCECRHDGCCCCGYLRTGDTRVLFRWNAVRPKGRTLRGRLTGTRVGLCRMHRSSTNCTFSAPRCRICPDRCGQPLVPRLVLVPPHEVFKRNVGSCRDRLGERDRLERRIFRTKPYRVSEADYAQRCRRISGTRCARIVGQPNLRCTSLDAIVVAPVATARGDADGTAWIVDRYTEQAAARLRRTPRRNAPAEEIAQQLF